MNLAQLAASSKLDASYFTKKQIKYCAKLIEILITQPQGLFRMDDFEKGIISSKFVSLSILPILATIFI